MNHEDPLVVLRFPKLMDLRGDPFERADKEAVEYGKWRIDHAFVMLPAQAYVGKHLSTYVEFPPRMKPGTFGLDQVLQKLQSGGAKAE